MPGDNLPGHIAIIMDGNRRWARKNRLKIALGHRKGVEALETVIRESIHLGVRVLSLFAFSTENWKCEPAEVSALMDLLLEFFTRKIDELHRENVCIRILGRYREMPEAQVRALVAAQEKTRNNTGLQLNIALNYGGRSEIVEAAKAFAADVLAGRVRPESLTEESFGQYLYTHDQPQVDLLIRTSGELRISNFLLYQCAYAEFEFPQVLWPDFDKEQFYRALEIYAERQRRFGG